ncbi:hypothetical protein JOF47_001792 [Paeniglutamicibacter kerguelensis]|uniref:Uncharacterized protein n=1 Tax=Paeniglutamicibacter kerguelensis TaxID=254788 RepID=A0ABS4XD45_9MICC|nr:hypothetical protein [Paeniglutamicibacter kerguelensis]
MDPGNLRCLEATDRGGIRDHRRRHCPARAGGHAHQNVSGPVRGAGTGRIPGQGPPAARVAGFDARGRDPHPGKDPHRGCRQGVRHRRAPGFLRRASAGDVEIRDLHPLATIPPARATRPSNAHSSSPRLPRSNARTIRPGPTTTGNGPRARNTTKPSWPWPDAGATSCSRCCVTAPSMRRRRPSPPNAGPIRGTRYPVHDNRSGPGPPTRSMQILLIICRWTGGRTCLNEPRMLPCAQCCHVPVIENQGFRLLPCSTLAQSLELFSCSASLSEAEFLPKRLRK